jgi:hypothetical protein
MRPVVLDEPLGDSIQGNWLHFLSVMRNRLAGAIASALQEQGAEVAHFKMSLTDNEGRLGVINQVMGGVAPEISKPFGGSFRRGRLMVNLRAEIDPALLQETVSRAMDELSTGSISARLLDMAAFRPGQPTPVRRITDLAEIIPS